MIDNIILGVSLLVVVLLGCFFVKKARKSKGLPGFPKNPELPVKQEQPPEQIQEQAQEQIQEQVQEQIQEQVQEQIQEQIQEQTQEQAQEQIQEQVQEQIQEQVQEQVHEQVQEQVQEKPISSEPTPEQLNSMRKGLEKTHSGFMAKLNAALFGKKGLSDDLIEELEGILYSSDIGVRTVSDLLDKLKARYAKTSGDSAPQVKESLKEEITALLAPTINGPKTLATAETKPTVYMFVGVNGVGKTTTIGKIAHQLIEQGKTVLLAAGDTFRAAAADQLAIWAERNNCAFYRGQEKQDPASVVFEAVKKATAENIDYVLVDTAGRLHTQANLMEELKKVHRVLGKARTGAPDEVLLVVDATTGQNAILQAKEFNNIVGLTGIILTKLDGTSKGGVVIGINAELQIPVRYVGVGEQIADLQPFSAAAFVQALFE